MQTCRRVEATCVLNDTSMCNKQMWIRINVKTFRFTRSMMAYKQPFLLVVQDGMLDNSTVIFRLRKVSILSIFKDYFVIESIVPEIEILMMYWLMVTVSWYCQPIRRLKNAVRISFLVVQTVIEFIFILSYLKKIFLSLSAWDRERYNGGQN